VKHFWAMIVWNYKEERIQIFHVTQATIRAAIMSLSENEDWGAPYFYDIKITKRGEKVDTEYSVIPSPKKPLPESIRQAFHAKPCDLEALFTNQDPFGSNPANGFTPGIFEEKASLHPTLSAAQQKEIMALCAGDDEIQARILSMYKVDSLDQIPAENFSTMKATLSTRKGGVK
jgi:hypothetical protein